LSNERVNLAQRQRHRQPAFEVPAEKTIGRHAEVEGRFSGVVDDGRAVFLSEGEHAKHAADPGGPFVLVDGGAHGADVCAGRRCPGEERDRARRRSRRTIIIVKAMPAAGRAQMLAQELSRLGGEQADVLLVPLHLDPLADPAGRGAVVGGLDLDAAIEVHRAFAVPVIAKRFERERPERGLLLRKHHGDLPLRRPVDARVGPARLPAIQVRLRLVETLKAQASQRRLLRVADARFDFPFPIRIADAARERDDAVVGEHVAIQRIERGIVYVGREHALFQVVEDDNADRRNARSWSSAQICALDRHTSNRTDLREHPRVRTKSRVRRYFPVLRSRTIGPPSP